MTPSLIVVALGAVGAVAGTGMLAARCVRAPRLFLVAWTVALFGLAVALAGQTLGDLAGYSGLTFRAIELGGQAIGPLALGLGLVEIVGRSVPARFAMRLATAAIMVVVLVILGTDPLNPNITFTKRWPDPAIVYQIVPKGLIELVAAVTMVTAVLTALVVLIRRNRGRQRAEVVQPALTAAAAAAFAALPGVNMAGHLALPAKDLFAASGALAAALIVFAARAAEHRGLLEAVPDRAGRPGQRTDRPGGGPRQQRGYSDDDHADGGRDRAGMPGGGYDGDDRDSDGVYPGLAALAAEPPGSAGGSGWPGGRGGPGRHGDADAYGDGRYDTGPYRDSGPYDPGQSDSDLYDSDLHDSDLYDSGPYTDAGPHTDPGRHTDAHYADAGRYEGTDGETGRHHQPDRYDDGAGAPDRGYAYRDENGDPDSLGGGARQPGHDRHRSLFGQITIYTLVEERVDEFDQLTEHVVEQVRAGEPGTLVYIVHAVPTAPLQRILYEVYQDHQAYDEHRATPYIGRYEADRRRCVLATNVIELDLRQAKVSPFPSFSTISDLLSESGIDLTGVTRSARGQARDRDPGRPGPGGPAAGDRSHPDRYSGGPYPAGPYQAERYQDGPYRGDPYQGAPSPGDPYQGAPQPGDPYQDRRFHGGPHPDDPYREGRYPDAPYRDAPHREAPYRDGPHRDAPYPDAPYPDGGWHDQPPAPGYYPPGEGPADEPGYQGWAELRREDSGSP